MLQSPSLPDIVAWRLLREQELQQVIVHELLRRKLHERAATDSHNFVLDRQHNLQPKPAEFSAVGNGSSVFTGIVGKSVGPTIASEHRSVRTDKNGNLSIFPNAKAPAKKNIERKIKVNSYDKLRRDRLQDMLLAEQSFPTDSVSYGRKMISPRKEGRDNLFATMAPRRHVLSLNLGALVSSPAPEHHSTASPRASLTDRHKDDSSHFVISFSSARSVRTTTLDLKHSSQTIAEFDPKSPDMSENLAIHSTTLGLGSQPHSLNTILGEGCPHFSSTRNLHKSKPFFAENPHVSAILGTSAPPGFLHKVHSLRSILANPVSCHLPATVVHPTTHNYTNPQTSDHHQQESSGDFEEWNSLIAKYDSQILKPSTRSLN